MTANPLHVEGVELTPHAEDGHASLQVKPRSNATTGAFNVIGAVLVCSGVFLLVDSIDTTTSHKVVSEPTVVSDLSPTSVVPTATRLCSEPPLDELKDPLSCHPNMCTQSLSSNTICFRSGSDQKKCPSCDNEACECGWADEEKCSTAGDGCCFECCCSGIAEKSSSFYGLAPSVFLIGAQKCATTSLSLQLEEHFPEIVMCDGEKEDHFFDEEGTPLAPDARTCDTYFKCQHKGASLYAWILFA
jgi:hypothetical protein